MYMRDGDMWLYAKKWQCSLWLLIVVSAADRADSPKCRDVDVERIIDNRESHCVPKYNHLARYGLKVWLYSSGGPLGQENRQSIVEHHETYGQPIVATRLTQSLQ